MEVIRIPGACPAAGAYSPTVVALGFFDGVHRGHLALLEKTRGIAASLGLPAAVCSFAEDGGIKAGRPRLTDEEERLTLLDAAGIDRVYLLDFAAVRHLTPQAFVEMVLCRGLAAAAVVCGFNFRFGAGGVGDATLLSTELRARGLQLTVMDPYCLSGQTVSASGIRAAIEAGDCERVVAWMGRPYTVCGAVLHGRAIGRRMGFPTANIAFSPGRVQPGGGVYAVTVTLPGGETVSGIANVGVRPTVSAGAEEPNCEVHLFDAPGDLYGRFLCVAFWHRLRAEMKFESMTDLAAQIAADESKAKEYFTWMNGQN